MSWYILSLIQFASVVKYIESAKSTNGIPAGSGMLLEIDNKVKTPMEVSYRRCIALPNEKLLKITGYSEIVTGENLQQITQIFD
uniref:Uncharacterized protein n=1 Tax=Rhodnius prolixus TaxID=13249 RepID=T1HVZ6_RHOPR